MELSFEHAFSEDEARERIRALGDFFQNRHGMQVAWPSPDTLQIRGKYTVIEIDVTATITPGRVHLQGKDPGMMLRGTAKKYIGGKLETYLNPNEPVAQLRRA